MVDFTVFSMKNIGIILNPQARINKQKAAAIINDLKDIFGDTALLRSTSNAEDTLDVIDEFKSEDIKFLLISGGDGTICNVLTSYINHSENNKLPVVVPLMGGTINMIGSDAGLRRNQIKICGELNHLIKHNSDIPITQRGLLKVSDSALPTPTYGFTWIDGLLYRFLIDYYEKGAGVQVASMLAVKTVLMSIADSTNGIFKQVDSIVEIDGEDLPNEGHIFLISSCLKKFVFGFNIFNNSPVPGLCFNTVYMREPYLKKSKHKIPLGLYKGLKSDNSGNFINKLVKRLRIKKNKGYIIDGEIFNHDTETEITITPGPKINVFSPKGEKELSIKDI